MPKIRARQRNDAEQCAVCRDGPEGLLICRGCGTMLHATCLIDVRGCPTIGCNERDPLEAKQDRCAHDTLTRRTRSCAGCGMSFHQTLLARAARSSSELPLGTIDVCPPGQCNHDMPSPPSPTKADIPLSVVVDRLTEAQVIDAAKSVLTYQKQCCHFFVIAGGRCEHCGIAADRYFAQLNKEDPRPYSFREWVDTGHDHDQARLIHLRSRMSRMQRIVDVLGEQITVSRLKLVLYVVLIILGMLSAASSH